jgi:3D (Asp-Asp-Asp) domain-containing protein
MLNVPPPRSDRSSPAAALPFRSLVAFSLVGFAVALSACAPVRGPRAPSEAGRRAPGAPADSDAKSAERAPGQTEPPSSSDVPTPSGPAPRVLLVRASAYNSRPGQTDRSPSIGAWGDRLAPGMKAIAVSKDLLALGLRRGQRVRIRGLEGEYVVMDRMPSRWRQKIDIYMGVDVRAARSWGVREVEIRWIPDEEELEAEASSSRAASSSTTSAISPD